MPDFIEHEGRRLDRISEELTPRVAVRHTEQLADGTVRFEAVVSEGDWVNANMRMYPLGTLWGAFEAIRNQLTRYPGLLDHPGWEDPSLSDVAIRWDEFFLEGALVVGRGVTVATQRGKDLAALLLSGLAVGFSTRGYGGTHPEEIDGRMVSVMDTFTFTPDGGVDAVITPSVRHARVRSVSAESETIVVSPTEGDRVQEETMNDELLRLRIEELEAANQEAAARLAQLQRENEEHARSRALLEMTSAEPFGAAILTVITELTSAGVQFPRESLSGVVPVLRALVENAATAAADATPRGVVETHEDEVADETAPTLTAEQLRDLRIGGLL